MSVAGSCNSRLTCGKAERPSGWPRKAKVSMREKIVPGLAGFDDGGVYELVKNASASKL